MSVARSRFGKKSLASFTALSLLLTVAALAVPLTPASANHPAGSYLDCEPDEATTAGTGANPVGTNHATTCTLRDAAGDPVAAQPAAVTVRGEVDCIDNCAGATYTGAASAPAAGGTPLDGDANDTPTDGNQPAGTDDDDRTDPDGTCVIPQGASSCTFNYTRNNGGTDRNAFWIEGDGGEAINEAPQPDDQDAIDEVRKEWQARVATDLDCTPDDDANPATDDPNTGGAQNQHTVTCQAVDQFGDNVAIPAGSIDGEYLSGPNDPDAGNNAPVDINNCGAQTGTCTHTYTNTGGNAGPDLICFFIDDTGTDTDLEECAAPEAFNADDPSTNSQDTVRKTWTARNAAALDCTPEDATNAPGDTTHTITCTARDQFGALAANQEIDGEVLAGSANDADGTTAPPDLTQTTNGQGVATFNVSDNRPANTFNDRVDTFCFFVDDDGNSNNLEECTAPEGLNDLDETDDESDVVRKTYQGGQAPNPNPATQVNAEPETATNPVNTTHTIGVSVRDANNQPTTATPVRADITSGPSANQGTSQAEVTCPTDPNPGTNQTTYPAGQTETHECTYTHNQFPNNTGGSGTDQITVFADTNNNGRFDAGEPNDQVTKTWSGQAFSLTLTPETDSATAGTCNEFTARVLDINGNPVVGSIVDVQQVLANAGTEPGEDRELAFCTPQNPQGPNPVTGPTIGNVAPGGGGTQFGDVQGNNQGSTAGQAGRNTTVRAEVGPTNQNGEVTFGITINQTTQNATVNVRAWVDTGGDNDTFDAGEPNDTSTKTWTPGGQGSVTTLNAEPESATNPNGTQHQVTVTLTGAGGPVQGVTPNSTFAANASGRPQGDVADPNAGASPNATVANQGNFNVYNCTVSNAQGISTCTFQDPTVTPAGTDTVVFFVNQAGGGTAGPDANEPQDAVQKTWTPGPQNLILDVTCAGSGTNDDRDVGEQGIGDNDANADCANPLTDADEVFTANVTNAQGVGQNNIRVDFMFGQRTNGNAAGANNSTNDATLSGGAGGGGQVGTSPAGLATFCITDANGTCSVTLNNPTPVAGDTIAVNGSISGQTVGGTPNDNATKQWQAGVVNQGGTLTLTPRAATNQVNTPHTVTATVRNQFGQPVQGANVDFQITQGPNAGLVQAGMTDATTDANGNATFTYTSSVTGQDTIVACSETGGSENDTCNAGEPTATAFKTWQTGPVTTNAVALDMDADDGANAGATGNPGQCELGTSGADPNRESTATNQISPTQALNANNFHRICAAAFQTNQAANQGRIEGAQITFTISGPGRIFAATANGQCTQTAQPPAGTTVTVTADQNGYAFACLYSQQVGRTTVTATSGNPAQTATGTKDWTVNPNTARFIQLCHGDVAGTTCDTAPATNAPGEQHQLTARVTDRQGNPVANVPVQFRETGPAIFIPQGGSSATVNTDANGLASVIMRSEVEGTSSVVAEIDPGNTTARQAGANNDECEAPAGTNNQPAAGNCISQTLSKDWETATTPPPTSPTPPDDGWERSVDLEASKNRKRFGKSFTLSGTVELRDASNAPASCRAGVPVEIQRDVLGGNDEFVLFDTVTTDSQGAFTASYDADRSANYVAFVGHSGAGNEECAEASSAPETVLVRVAVRLKINKTRVNRGTRVTLRVKFLPCEGHERDKALLFKSIQGKFGKVGKKRTNDNCVAKFRKRIWKDTVFQARWPKQHADHIQGKSRPKAVQVRGRR